MKTPKFSDALDFRKVTWLTSARYPQYFLNYHRRLYLGQRLRCPSANSRLSLSVIPGPHRARPAFDALKHLTAQAAAVPRAATPTVFAAAILPTASSTSEQASLPRRARPAAPTRAPYPNQPVPTP